MSKESLLSPWTLPQPIYVFGSAILAASAFVTNWMDPTLLVTILLILPIPLCLILERIIPNREDWLLDWSDFFEDMFWVAATMFIWIPIYDERYDTPIAAAFTGLREAVNFPYALEASTIGGILLMGLIGSLASEFISYWLHRLQHRFMFFWRIHATHHHITKLSVARADRTHPLEFLGLNFGSAVAFSFLGASGEVVAVGLVLRLTTAYTSHANLPLEPGIFGWFFNTPRWHALHHSCNYKDSNTNFGCSIIVWDRLFGTFSDKKEIEKIGNGTGEKLSIWTQLTIPFRSNKVLKEL